MTFPYTPECDESCALVLKPVPGAENWPRRLECVTHGYPSERPSRVTISDAPEPEKPNSVYEVLSKPEMAELHLHEERFEF